jgi:DNA-binding response OmpR family regulator
VEPHEKALKKTILVVERTEELREAIEDTLRVEGYDVHSARNEKSAVTCARQNSPDLILVTLQGPRGWLLPLAREIRYEGGLDKRTPIVIFSMDAIAIGEEEKLAGNIYITAPNDLDQLRSLLRHILSGRENRK